MGTFRHHDTHRLIAGLLFAVTLLVPFKVVFACTMMDQVVKHCCCDQEGCEHSTTFQEAMPNERCCAVTFEASEDGKLAVTESVGKQPVNKLWDSSPDVATAPPAPAATTAFLSSAQISLLSEPYAYDGSALYLLTARLRL
jgi:hypothetical protein